MNPSSQLSRSCGSFSLVNPPTQRRCLQPTGTKVEGEVNDGRESSLWLCGQHRAVAKRGGECCAQILMQVGLALFLVDRWMVWLAQTAVADRPVACRADVGMRTARVVPWYAVKPLEAFGQIYGRLRNRNHDRTRSNTRPRNQKFNTPAQSAWSASVQACR